MAFNKKDKKTINDYFTEQRAAILQGTRIKVGDGRSDEIKEANFMAIYEDLAAIGINNRVADVQEVAGMIATIVGRPVDVQAPPTDNGAARKLAVLIRDSSTVQHVIANVDVRIDIDQLKHQHRTQPIGTRHKGGGNRFDATCDAHWHQTVTMTYMAAWANQLGVMAVGQTESHGQLVPVNNVHYEGHCLFANGQKYVIFHCYPSDNSPLRGPNG